MKTKILLITICIAIFGICLVACTPVETPPLDDDPPIVIPETTFSVFFSSSGGTSVANYNLTDVEFGATVEPPKTNPSKRGYTFGGWSLSQNGDAVDVKSHIIVADTTFYAVWIANEYTYTLSLTDEKIKDNVRDIGDASVADYFDGKVRFVDKNGQAISTDKDGTYVYYENGSNVETIFQKDGVVTTQISFQDASVSGSYFKSLPIPKTDVADDYFVYWYYYDGEDRVQLTSAETAGTSSQQTRFLSSNNYAGDRTVYAMWHSTLNWITVKFDSGNDASKIDDVVIKIGDSISAPQPPTRVGYVFDKWVYDTVDSEGKDLQVAFKFQSSPDVQADKISTQLATDGVFTLTALWIKTIFISNASDFNIDCSKSENLTATIVLTADVTLDDWQPLFSKEQPFVGVFDGAGHTITYNLTRGNQNLSLLGHTEGTIKNLKVRASIVVKDFSSVEQDTIYIGGLVSSATGNIANVTVDVTSCSITADKAVCVGGIIGENLGATIDGCESTLNAILIGRSVYAGGFVGINQSGTVLNCKANVGKFSPAVSINVTQSTNSYVGGFAGKISSGTFMRCNLGKAVLSVTSSLDAKVGGLAGYVIAGAISEFNAVDVQVRATSKTTAAGGIAGEAGAQILNCNVKTVFIDAVGENIARAGGIVGYNKNEGGDRGQIKYVILNDGKVQASSDNGSAYAGGIAGQSYAGSTTTSIIVCVYADADVSVDAKSGGQSYTIATVDNPETCNRVYYDSTSKLTRNGDNVTYSPRLGEIGKVISASVIKDEIVPNLNLNATGKAIWKFHDVGLPTLEYVG